MWLRSRNVCDQRGGDEQGNRVRIPNGTAAVCVELVPSAVVLHLMKVCHWETEKAGASARDEISINASQKTY